MTTDELFNQITKEIAFPHTTITKHDKKQAIETMKLFQKFLGNCEMFHAWDIAMAIDDKIDEIEEEMDIDNFLATQDVCNIFVKDWEAIKV